VESWVWIAIVAIAAAVILGIAWMVTQQRNTSQVAERFGPEYEREVRATGDRRRAVSELEAREKRVEALDIRPLSRDEQHRFNNSWHSVQTQFVDDPAEAVDQADVLVAEVMQARGYPVGDFEQRTEDISVGHADVVQNYRAAHQIALRNEEGQATTEDLRQAMMHYRSLFDDLLDTSAREAH
jgi:hypothetical protein